MTLSELTQQDADLYLNAAKTVFGECDDFQDKRMIMLFAFPKYHSCNFHLFGINSRGKAFQLFAESRYQSSPDWMKKKKQFKSLIQTS
jgi:hypothetical protein